MGFPALHIVLSIYRTFGKVQETVLCSDRRKETPAGTERQVNHSHRPDFPNAAQSRDRQKKITSGSLESEL